jgi:hypothetical protein
MRVAIAALAAAALAGCSGGPFPEQEKRLRSDMIRHFAELNAEAGVRAQEAKATKSDIDVPGTALVLNHYEWDLEGQIFPNVECINPSCLAKIGTLVLTDTRPESKLRCLVCNTDLREEMNRVGRGLPMFEIKSGNSLPIVVLVRYVRHSMVYDPNSLVSVSPKTEASNPIEPYTKERGMLYAAGFYRTAASALCTTAFVYKGGELHQVDPRQVDKMIADPPENVPVNSMKLGRWGAVEKPLTPWLGRPPAASVPKEAPKSP